MTVSVPRHRSERRVVRVILTLLRSVAIEGSLVARVAEYRERHAFAEREGARHSPHTGR